MRRVDVQKNKNKQKQQLKSKKIKDQWEVYSSSGASINIAHINLSRRPFDVSTIKLPVKYKLTDLTGANTLEMLFICRASDLLILTVTDVDVDSSLVSTIKLCMPATVIAYDKKLKNVANRLAKDFGAPKTCEVGMLNMILKTVELHCPASATERPYMLADGFDQNSGILTVGGFMKDSLKSDRVVINGSYIGTIIEVAVDQEVIPGCDLNTPSEPDELVFPYANVKSRDIESDRMEFDGEVEMNETSNTDRMEFEVEVNETSNTDRMEFESEEEVEYEVEDTTEPEVDLISKYAEYKGVRNLATCTFPNRAEDIPDYYKEICFFKNQKQSFNRIKNRKSVIPKNRNVVLKIQLPDGVPVLSPSTPLVLYNLFENEGRSTIMNYEFTSTEPLPEVLCVYNGVGLHEARCITTRNLTCGAFKGDPELTTGVVSFIAPLLHGSSATAHVLLGGQDSSIVRLYNGTSEDRVFFDGVELTGWPVKVSKRSVTVKGMFYNKEQVEYFSSVRLEGRRGISGFIKKALGTKGVFKAYFAQQVKYGESILMKLYKRRYLGHR